MTKPFLAGIGVVMGLLISIEGGWTEETKPPAKEPTESLMVVKEKGGTRFLSLRDWPVTRKGGVIKAAPLEEYLSMKFGQVSDALEQVNQRFDAMERRMNKLEEAQGALQQRLRALDERLATREGIHGSTTEEPVGEGQAGEGPADHVP